jgi:multisubunit Na+/H+ antiporter MnhC subunit
MTYWLREIAGWVLVVIGLLVFWQAYGLLVNKRVFEAGPTVVIGFVVFRGGIHLLKVAVAAQAARKLPLAVADTRRRPRTPGKPIGPTASNTLVPGPQHPARRRDPLGTAGRD